MKTPAIQAITTQVSDLKKDLAEFKSSDFKGQKFGAESEYTATAVVAELRSLLNDISILTKAHKKFVDISSHDERNQILSNLQHIKSFVDGKDCASLANYVEALKILIRPYQVRGWLESHKKLLDRTEQLDTIIAGYEDKLKQYAQAAKVGVAFTARYNDEKGKLWKNFGWLVGAFAFILIPIIGGIFFLTSQEAITVGSAITRLAIMSAAIYGAWFCATRYVRYKNITEDYGYKSVLANSMIAFLEQFQGDENKDERILYLQTVLREMFQDPLRKQHDMQHPASGVLHRFKKDAETNQ